MASIRDGLRDSRSWVELPRRATAEAHYVVTDGDELLRLCRWARENEFYICTMTPCDERMLEDNVFKLYIVLSSPTGELTILEHPLKRNSVDYLSIRESFASAEPLERAAKDLFGLAPINIATEERSLLHSSFPTGLYPLRPNRTSERLQNMLNEHTVPAESVAELPRGVLVLIVGPIHAGVIEAGQFRFYVAGEVIEDLDIHLGYKHRGIERLFEKAYTLTTGQKLAECVSGDSSFAHSLAYCQAVENLTGDSLPLAALCWRGLLLEMERLYNHIGDVAALVHDIAFDFVASELAVLRERVVRLNNLLTGSRFLRGVNHPGGVEIRFPHYLPEARQSVRRIVDQFLYWVDREVLSKPACRERYLTTGVLTRAEAIHIGATGLPARASGLWQQDFRLRQPSGVYISSGLGDDLRGKVEGTTLEYGISPSQSSRKVPVYRQKDLSGDAFARLLMRAAEVETSVLIIERLAMELAALDNSAPTSLGSSFEKSLRDVDILEIGLGYVEGWRGDVFYFVVKGSANTIFRCQPRDPSLYNWPALRLAVIRKPQDPDRPSGKYWENILADFPVINKSFNLSYAGHDN